MSGDVQPRKRNKDKKRRREDSDVSRTSFDSFRKLSMKNDEETRPTGVNATKMGPDDIQLHVHSDHDTGGHWCAKVLFFSLLAVLLGLIGIILLENRGISDLDTPLSESRFAEVLEGWVDEKRETHDDHEDEHTDGNDLEDSHEDEGFEDDHNLDDRHDANENEEHSDDDNEASGTDNDADIDEDDEDEPDDDQTDDSTDVDADSQEKEEQNDDNDDDDTPDDEKLDDDNRSDEAEVDDDGNDIENSNDDGDDDEEDNDTPDTDQLEESQEADDDALFEEDLRRANERLEEEFEFQ